MSFCFVCITTFVLLALCGRHAASLRVLMALSSWMLTHAGRCVAQLVTLLDFSM